MNHQKTMKRILKIYDNEDEAIHFEVGIWKHKHGKLLKPDVRIWLDSLTEGYAFRGSIPELYIHLKQKEENLKCDPA